MKRSTTLATEERILTLATLANWHKAVAGASVALATGCFDIVHMGHVAFLQQAAALSDLLVVGLNSDASIKALKGSKRPVLPEESRIRVMLAFGVVDYVFVFDEPDARNWITHLRPNMFAMGEESINLYPDEVDSAQAAGAQICAVRRVPSVSTTSVIETIGRLS